MSELLEKTLYKYACGEISLAKAAEDSGMSLWQIIEEVQKHGIAAYYSIKDFKEDAHCSKK